jgi:hypothetical protein
MQPVRDPACAPGSRSRQLRRRGAARGAARTARSTAPCERLEPAQGPRRRRGAAARSRPGEVLCRGRQPGLPGRQEHGRGTAAALRDDGHGGLPGGAGFGHDRPGRVAHFAGRAGRQRRAGAAPGEQPRSCQARHAPGITLSAAVRCGHDGRARRVRATTVARLSPIPAIGRRLLRAPPRAVRDSARRGQDRLPGRHPPGQRARLAADRITGCAGDCDVPPGVDSLAHKPSRNHREGERRAGRVQAGQTARLVNAIPRIRRRGPAPAVAPVIAQDPPERRHRAHTGLQPFGAGRIEVQVKTSGRVFEPYRRRLSGYQHARYQ